VEGVGVNKIGCLVVSCHEQDKNRELEATKIMTRKCDYEIKKICDSSMFVKRFIKLQKKTWQFSQYKGKEVKEYNSILAFQRFAVSKKMVSTF